MHQEAVLSGPLVGEMGIGAPGCRTASSGLFVKGQDADCWSQAGASQGWAGSESWLSRGWWGGSGIPSHVLDERLIEYGAQGAG